MHIEIYVRQHKKRSLLLLLILIIYGGGDAGLQLSVSMYLETQYMRDGDTKGDLLEATYQTVVLPTTRLWQSVVLQPVAAATAADTASTAVTPCSVQQQCTRKTTAGRGKL